MNKSKIVNISSNFPVPKNEVFVNLQSFKTLSYIARPYIRFLPIDKNQDFVWKKGGIFTFKTKLLGIIPFGIHTINVIEFNENTFIYTNETNTYVKIWNHKIELKSINENETEYRDIVEIYAGWKTYFVYIWAKLFYRHRQKRWIKLLSLKNKI